MVYEKPDEHFGGSKKTFISIATLREYSKYKIGEDFIEIKGYWTDQCQAKLNQFPKDKKFNYT